jgi:hypothetical protein
MDGQGPVQRKAGGWCGLLAAYVDPRVQKRTELVPHNGPLQEGSIPGSWGRSGQAARLLVISG